LVKFPGNAQGRTVQTPVTQADFAPTILDIAGIRRPPGLPGTNLQTIDQLPRREIASTSFACNGHVHPRFSRVERAYLVGSTKFIWSTTGKRELYDLSKDPREEKNQYRSGDPEIQKLAAGLASWVKAVTPAKAEKGEQVDPEAMRRLRTLGYVQ
jgi:arylsulfatase A-like enzyme